MLPTNAVLFAVPPNAVLLIVTLTVELPNVTVLLNTIVLVNVYCALESNDVPPPPPLPLLTTRAHDPFALR